jgi:hypothetical protein
MQPGPKKGLQPQVVESLQHAPGPKQPPHWLALHTQVPLTQGTFLLQLPQERVPPQLSLCEPHVKPWVEQDLGPQHWLW